MITFNTTLRTGAINEIQKVTGLDETAAKLMYWVFRLGKDDAFYAHDIFTVMERTDENEEEFWNIFDANPTKMWKFSNNKNNNNGYKCTNEAKKIVLSCIDIVAARRGLQKFK